MLKWLILYYKDEITVREMVKKRDFWYDFLIYYAIVFTMIVLAIVLISKN